jgi:hypothetical protein
MAIQQHPLPQDISNYRFRLIGDMTIKQFASLAIFIILAIIVYGLPLPFFFRYPLTFICVILGVGIAFVPLQGRTLDVWIIAFIKSIYAPTIFSWKKTQGDDINPDTLAPTTVNNDSSAPTVSNPIMEINSGRPAPTVTSAVIPAKAGIHPDTPTTPEEPTPTTLPVTPDLPVVIARVCTQTARDSFVTNLSRPEDNDVAISHTSPIESPEPVTAPSEPTPVEPVVEPLNIAKPSITPPTTQPVSNLPIPFTPTTPNTLVGLTIDKDNHIIDGVLVEIKKNGITTRATKSNKLGQFMFARPLENGIYQILAEKEGNTFTTYSLELTGEIIRPLKIQAQ